MEVALGGGGGGEVKVEVDDGSCPLPRERPIHSPPPAKGVGHHRRPFGQPEVAGQPRAPPGGRGCAAGGRGEGRRAGSQGRGGRAGRAAHRGRGWLCADPTSNAARGTSGRPCPPGLSCVEVSTHKAETPALRDRGAERREMGRRVGAQAGSRAVGPPGGVPPAPSCGPITTSHRGPSGDSSLQRSLSRVFPREGRARGLRSGEKRVPGPGRLPRHPGSRLSRPLLPRGGPHPPPSRLLRVVNTPLQLWQRGPATTIIAIKMAVPEVSSGPGRPGPSPGGAPPPCRSPAAPRPDPGRKAAPPAPNTSPKYGILVRTILKAAPELMTFLSIWVLTFPKAKSLPGQL